MGEIDTKPIESVQIALTLFGQKNDQRKQWSSSNDRELEKELEDTQKDLANYKVQVEVKESAYMQALLKIEHYQKIVDELSTLLKNSEVERDMYTYKCREATTQIDKLESKTKDMADQLSESANIRQQLSHVLSELKAAQAELLRMETELSAVTESKLEAMTQSELMEIAVNMENEKAEDLLKHVLELNEIIYLSKGAAIEAEKMKCTILSEKEAELQLANEKAVQAQEQLEDIKKQMESMYDLENQLLAKSIFIDCLQGELKQAHELSSSSAEAASNAVNELNQLKTNLEFQERKNSDQLVLIESLQMELDHLKLGLKNANEEVACLNLNIDRLTSGLQEAQNEMNETKERETEAQVEIALLKSELHRGRSKIAAAEAAEARANNVKSGLYLAVQQLAVEADEAKKENQRFKEGAGKAADGTADKVFVSSQLGNSFQEAKLSQIDESKTDAEETRDDIESHITISTKDYKSLVKKAGKADQLPASVPENPSLLTTSENIPELKALKKELDVAMMKISEFRTRAEQAVSRAEAAEKAKSVVEDQLRRWREQKQRRKAALAALREETVPRASSPRYESTPMYQPLEFSVFVAVGGALQPNWLVGHLQSYSKWQREKFHQNMAGVQPVFEYDNGHPCGYWANSSRWCSESYMEKGSPKVAHDQGVHRSREEETTGSINSISLPLYLSSIPFLSSNHML